MMMILFADPAVDNIAKYYGAGQGILASPLLWIALGLLIGLLVAVRVKSKKQEK